MSRHFAAIGPMEDTVVVTNDDHLPPRENCCLLCRGALESIITGVTDNRLGAPGEYEIRRCVACGLEQTFPAPTQTALTELYEKYYNFGGIKESVYSKLRERFLFSFLNRIWVTLDGDVAFHLQQGDGRLLDIGCNEGRGLKIFRRNGFQVQGLELNSNAAAIAREDGFAVHVCLIEDFRPTLRFDIAVLSNVLEHTLEPERMLTDVHRILDEKGHVWISCPNSHSWLRALFGKRWINWHVPFHISHFSESTLRQLLERTGYTEIEIKQITPAHWVSQSLIASIFAKPGRKTTQLRNPFLTFLFLSLTRFLAFPILWLGNRLGRGDCLQAVAIKKGVSAVDCGQSDQ